MFLPEDAPTIISIPIREQNHDFIAWHFDHKGMLSVKSAYKVFLGCVAVHVGSIEGSDTVLCPSMRSVLH